MEGGPVKLFDAVTVTGTNVARSEVITKPANREHTSYSVTLTKTNTGEGVVTMEINNMGEVEYDQAVKAAGGEAANTSGWFNIPFNEAASITIAATNPDNHTVDVTELAAKRSRLVFTSTTGTNVVTARAA